MRHEDIARRLGKPPHKERIWLFVVVASIMSVTWVIAIIALSYLAFCGGRWLLTQ